MPPIPEYLWLFWDHAADNFSSYDDPAPCSNQSDLASDSLDLIAAECYDGPHSRMSSWACPVCEDFWRMSIRNMMNRTHPCRHCNPSSQGISSNRRGLPHILGIDSVEAVNHEISQRWGTIFLDENSILYMNEDDPWSDELLPGSKKHISLVCTRSVDDMGRYDPTGEVLCNHVSNPRLSSVTGPMSPGRRPAQCPSCSLGGDAINNFDSKNALSITNPLVASELLRHPDGKSADQIKAGSMKRCDWRCHLCEHEFSAEINMRTRNGTRDARTECPACENLQVHIDGRNSLQTVYPNVAQHWDFENNRLTPDDVTYGSTYTAHWICRHTDFTDYDGECGHPHTQRIFSRTQFLVDGESHVPCECCCPGGGYRNYLPGYYYVLEWIYPDGRVIYKNGISNVPLNRIAQLAGSLYETFGIRYRLVQIIMHANGGRIRELETCNLRTDRVIRDVDFLGVDGRNEMFTMNMIDHASANGDLPDGWVDVTNELRSQIENVICRTTGNEGENDSVS